MNAKKIFESAMNGLKKEWPKIATGLGAGLLVVGGYLVGREVPRYKEELKRKEEEKGEALTGKEKFVTGVKHFGPAAGAIVSGVTMVAASAIENDKRLNLATGAAALSEIASKNATKNLLDYKEAAKEVLDEEEKKKVDEKVKEKKLQEYGCTCEPCDYIPEGRVLCYDLHMGGEPFVTDYNTLRGIENEIKSRLLASGDGAAVTLSEAYDLMGRKYTMKAADPLGWIFDDKPSHRNVDFHIDAAIVDGKPSLTICPEVVMIEPDYYDKPYRKYW